jgi:RES domain-containing protein
MCWGGSRPASSAELVGSPEVRVWRLQRATYAALSGEGARRYGGRWNSRGAPVVYAASSLSLATLELLVHVDPDLVPDDLLAYEIHVPDDLGRDVVGHRDLLSDWREPENPHCKTIGDSWLAEGRVPLLLVPSVIVPEEINVLINPVHPDAGRVTVVSDRPYVFDSRLAK